MSIGILQRFSLEFTLRWKVLVALCRMSVRTVQSSNARFRAASENPQPLWLSVPEKRYPISKPRQLLGPPRMRLLCGKVKKGSRRYLNGDQTRVGLNPRQLRASWWKLVNWLSRGCERLFAAATCIRLPYFWTNTILTIAIEVTSPQGDLLPPWKLFSTIFVSPLKNVSVSISVENVPLENGIST